ncbi:unnamed protein product [Rotaria magnacalcarata]|uniref:Uncharacterized protein n=2 Tax=Rotaria magnacalcarata TaxID=392030 RepID=A0A816LUR9_9BILA|nr:unnamed protein product [Rotaria magnacalcarata]
MSIFYLFVGFVLFIYSRAGNVDWLLFSIESHECFLYDKRFFCRHLDTDENTSCVNGTAWYFPTLQEHNITTDSLLDWFIPFEDIERYARYLDSLDTFDDKKNLICNCSLNRIGFGCKYELFSDLFTIEAVVEFQLSRPAERLNEIPACIVDGIECNAGALCLEWRQVCDGIVNCDNGADETNCHFLEFHQCSLDEFQCRNRMCIPLEFLFDGLIDCMDASDEQEIFTTLIHLYKCPSKSAWECDEHFCDKNEFSCGDGQCIHWSNLLNHQESCKNYRDIAYRCELIPRMVTMANGICFYGGKIGTSSNISLCAEMLQRLLAGLSRKIALTHLIHNCSEIIQYPEQPILLPVLRTFYNKSLIISFYKNHSLNEQLPKTVPDIACLNGSIMCNGTHTRLLEEHCVNYNEIEALALHPFLPITDWFCQVARAQQQRTTSKNITILWQSNTSIAIRSLESFLCRWSTNPMSISRVNDGQYDCLLHDDEINNKYYTVQSYRYRCSSSTTYQFVSFSQLGNGIEECLDGSDEISRELEWSFFRCEYEDDYACWVFRGGINDERIKEVQLLFHRHCDSIWDTMDGLDEQNCSEWVCTHGMYQCKVSGQCISQSHLCDGEFDCNNGEDELNCSKSIPHWSIEDHCDKFTEHFCITPEFIANQTFYRPCIDYAKAGDGKIDCVGGRDERNVFSCIDHRMLGDRFLCDKQTKCMAHTFICNGIFDCEDRTDELICFWNHHQCYTGQFPCWQSGKCIQQRCTSNKGCSNNEHLFWCPNSDSLNATYRSSKIRRPSNYDSFCRSYYYSNIVPSSMVSHSVTTRVNFDMNIHGFCNRGFYLIRYDGNRPICFCPPSFYGDRCQFNRRRITIRVRFERQLRSDLPRLLHVLVSLVCNHTVIVDHQIFVDISQEISSKHDIYLLYSRPKVHGTYSVRFEAYNIKNLLSVWEYLISPLDFLPVFRLTKVFRFADRSLPWLCSISYCKNEGTCYVVNQNHSSYVCLCQKGWQGLNCEKRLDQSKCAPHALVRGENLCICPYGYLLPHCFVQNTICQRSNPCLSNEICYPLSVLPPHRYSCLCNIWNCNNRSKAIIVLTKKVTNDQPLLLQLLKISSDYPRVRQQLLIPSFTLYPTIQVINTLDARHKQGAVPEIALLYTFHPKTAFVDIMRSLLYINCSNLVRNVTIDLDTQAQRCHPLNEHMHQYSVKVFHTFCLQSKFHPCFYSENYMCYCNVIVNRSECISYQQRNIACTHCINQGYCAQGDLQNRSDFACICPKCTTGTLCQFASNRFSISLEILVEKSHWGRLHFIGPTIFLLIGLLCNGLCISTFTKRAAQQSGVGLYLLINAIISQLILILLFTRVIYLVLTRNMSIHLVANTILCKSLPYLMSSLHFLSQWLMAFVTVERAFSVIFIVKFRSIRTPKFAIILTTITSVVIFSSLYGHLVQHRLVTHPDELISWCIREIQLDQQSFVQYTSLVHQVIPFIVNLFSGLIIIFRISHSKAISQRLSPRNTLVEEIWKRIDLLLGPIICFITQLPQLITLFIDACTYEGSIWFVNITIVAYYISFTPQITLFITYLLPSPTYKKLLLTQTFVRHIL